MDGVAPVARRAIAAIFFLIYAILRAMAEQSVIVWDLETIPDLAAAARMLDLRNADDAEIRGRQFRRIPQ
jgi:P pilus assembly chaperone PapD